MSSETLSRSSSQTRPSGTTTVTPQQVTDPTILDSVAGFINDVVPTTYNGPSDSKDQIQWARFEQIELDQSIYSEYDYDKVAPSVLILILGYTTGVQIWSIPANGEATEILSWRHGSVKVLKILPHPSYVGIPKIRDEFKLKRPILALSDTSTATTHLSSVNFLSLKTGEQVKVIKFKNPVLDVLANKHSVVVTFPERIAVFDAFTLEDRLTVTTCYLSPGLLPNPVTLGTRWMAYAEKKLNSSKRSSGGNDGEGIHSYTATVIQAAKSLGRGLRELGESVASSLTGNSHFRPGTSPNSPQAGGISDVQQKGVVTILDIENKISQNKEKTIQNDAVVGHFTAHTEAIVYLQFDPSGLLLVTADKRGHDFHLFRIHPHPAGSALAAVHHLYVLHRGDTTARVQDMCFSPDSRWVAISTIRGTTHVFPVTPYGGNVGVRTHATPHVVNKMSRFHRSAGLTVDGRSNSPVSIIETPINSHYPYHNPRFPPFPHPTLVHPLAQIRPPVSMHSVGPTPQRTQSGRQRLSSSSEDNIALRVVACFAPPRAWIDIPTREPSLTKQPKSVESLFIMSCYGILVQYDLEPQQASNVAKEKVCSDTPIELSICARAQWVVQRQPNSPDLPLPMVQENINLFSQDQSPHKRKKSNHNDDQWLSQVEIVTHAGPHRRLWMGPQFTFKTYTTTTGSPMSVAEAQPIDLGHTKPVNMPITKANAVLIESSSASSCEQSLLDTYQRTFEQVGGAGEVQLKEDLADAMLESPGVRETGGRCVIVQMKPAVAKVVNPLGTVVNVHSDDDTDVEICEDVIIHENCDEALFRPMVVPKVVPLHERTKRYGDNIITKSLESTTEVAVKILDKTCNTKLHKIQSYESSIKHERTEKEVQKIDRALSTIDSTTKSSKSTAKPASKVKIDISDLVTTELSDFKTVPESKILEYDAKFPTSKTLKKTELAAGSINKHAKFEEKALDNKDFFLLDSPSKADQFEEIQGQSETFMSTSIKEKIKSKTKSQKEKLQGLDDSSNTSEETTEEKIIPKRARKPKPKLGVKITNINKENKIEKITEDCLTEITTSAPFKKSWSTVAATKLVEEPLIESFNKESNVNLNLPKIDFVEEFTFHLPKKSNATYVVTDLIDINTPQEEKARSEEVNNKMEEEICDNIDLLKTYKSSDDEKGDTSSSPAEITESDDSGKNATMETVFEELDSSAAVPMSKSSRRKKRKK